jgi:hypothetical protein
MNTKEVITEQALLYFINKGRKKPYKTLKNALKYCGYGQEFTKCNLINLEKAVKYFK